MNNALDLTALNKSFSGNASIIGRPDQRLIDRMAPYARQNIKYKVRANAASLQMMLEVSASSYIRASVNLPSVVIENGIIQRRNHMSPLVWADTGVEACIRTALPVDHLLMNLSATDIVEYFLGAFNDHIETCPTQWKRWGYFVQYMADHIARERGTLIEIHAWPRLENDPIAGSGVRRPWDRPHYEVIEYLGADGGADGSTSRYLPGYEADLLKIDEQYTPTASTLTLAGPNFVIKQPRMEIFQAKP